MENNNWLTCCYSEFTFDRKETFLPWNRKKKLISFISVKNLSSCTLKIITQNRLSLHKSATDLKVSLTEEKRDLLDLNPNPKQDGRFVASFGKCK